MTLLSPEAIIDAVKVEDDNTRELRERFEADYSRYRLDPFRGIERPDMEGGEEGFTHHTSSDPQAFADKLIGFAVKSKMILRIRNTRQQEHQRDWDNMKERFMRGVLRAGDERLKRLMRGLLKNEITWHAALRGFIFGRALLVKRRDPESGSITTQIDITPWDPLHTYWKMDNDGLAWACHVSFQTLLEIQTEYPDADLTDLADQVREARNGDTLENKFRVYDFYNKRVNTTVMVDRVLKEPTVHGGFRVPVFYNVVGAQPRVVPSGHGANISSRNGSGHGSIVSERDTIRDWGESVYKGARSIYDTYNQMISIMVELAGRSRDPTLLATSADGKMTFEEDPRLMGSDISLMIGEDVKYLEPLRSNPDLAPLLALVSGEVQRRTFPNQVYGDIPFTLSGFAIQTLSQGLETVLDPILEAVGDSIRQICRLISDQYQTGFFDNMELSGEDANRQYFREIIRPDVIRAGGDIEVKLVSTLPQDDVQKASLAQLYRDGPNPLLDDRTIRDDILEIDDADSVEDRILEQQGERVLPLAYAWSQVKAQSEAGNMDNAAMWFSEWMKLQIQTNFELAQAQAIAQQTGLGVQPPPTSNPQPPQSATQMGRGIPPTVAPSQVFNNGANPADISNPGAQVPPGTPRFGALSVEDQRLAQLGLQRGQ